jgi:phage internal scaffolding protein
MGTKKEFRSAYDGKRFDGIVFDHSLRMTEQCHKDQCDIMNIINQYDRTGLLTHINTSKAEFGDYSGDNDYQKNLNMVMEAQENFMQLPSKVRQEFDNDPGKFLAFASDEKNAEKFEKFGLTKPKEKEVISKVEIINKSNTKESNLFEEN